jgi:hypothetical protein
VGVSVGSGVKVNVIVGVWVGGTGVISVAGTLVAVLAIVPPGDDIGEGRAVSPTFETLQDRMLRIIKIKIGRCLFFTS